MLSSGQSGTRPTLDEERAEDAIERLGPSITSQVARSPNTLNAQEVRVMGSKSVFLRTLIAVSSAKTPGFGAPSSEVALPTRVELVFSD